MKNYCKLAGAVLCSAMLFSWTGAAQAQVRKQEEKPAMQAEKLPDIKTMNLGGNVYMLVGRGGNVGLLAGDDGNFLIDDQYAHMAPKILAAVKAVNGKPVRFLLNTHYHGDHSGGNAVMQAHGADIIAHDNVRKRLTTPTDSKLWKRTIEPTVPETWPVLTYSENATLYLNGATVHIYHTPDAHTDGDSIVHFVEANVIHMGDNFFNRMLPFIDVDSGGSVDGVIAAHDIALALANEGSKIIPGHGDLASRADLQASRDRLVDMRDMIRARIEAGEGLAAILADNPLEKYAEYASFITPEILAEIIFRSLTDSSPALVVGENRFD